MPEITVVLIGIIAAALIIGMTIGWIVRGNRSKSEKAAINAGWQEQLEAHRSEHQRLVEQNKSLMEQNSQYQASNKDAKMRASELSEALKEAFARRDDLQRQIKDIRGNLEIAVSERKQLQQDMHSRASKDESLATTLRDRDAKIQKLNRELDNWQDRLPPLIERYRKRNEEAERLELELETARQRIQALETMVGSDETRVEPVGPGSLQDGLDASNEPMDDSQTGTAEAIDAVPDTAGDAMSPVESRDADEDAQAATEDEGEDEMQQQEAATDRDDDEAVQEEKLEASWNDLLAADEEEVGDEAVAQDDEDEASFEDEDDFGDDDVNARPTGGDEDAVDDEDVYARSTGDDEDDFDDDDVYARSTGDDDFAASLARDDLKMIKGVGPAIEKTLNEMGIFRFDQIAGMSEYDIDRVANRLKGFRTRIYREDWIGQARELQDRKASGQS